MRLGWEKAQQLQVVVVVGALMRHPVAPPCQTEGEQAEGEAGVGKTRQFLVGAVQTLLGQSRHHQTTQSHPANDDKHQAVSVCALGSCESLHCHFLWGQKEGKRVSETRRPLQTILLLHIPPLDEYHTDPCPPI